MSDALTELIGSGDVPAEVAKAYRKAIPLLSPQQVERAVDRLAVRLTVELQNTNPLLLLHLPDALVLAGMLMRRLVFPLQVGLLTVADEQVSWLGEPDLLKIQTRPWVVIHNDICSTSAQAVQSWLALQAAEEIYAVSMFAAQTELQYPHHAALSLTPEGCFGSGQSIMGYGANLTGVFRLNNEPKGA